MFLLCFLKVGTSAINVFSNQKSSRFAHAIQTCFLAPQITQNLKKWPKSVSNGPPKIHQKQLKIKFGTFKGPPECTLAPNDRQIGAKVVPQDPKNSKNDLPRPLKFNKCECNPAWKYVQIVSMIECKFTIKQWTVLLMHCFQSCA